MIMFPLSGAHRYAVARGGVLRMTSLRAFGRAWLAHAQTPEGIAKTSGLVSNWGAEVADFGHDDNAPIPE